MSNFVILLRIFKNTFSDDINLGPLVDPMFLYLWRQDEELKKLHCDNKY